MTLRRWPAAALLLALGGAGLPPGGSQPEVRSASDVPPLPAAWSQYGRPSGLAAQAITLLHAAAEHGLDPADYDVEALAAAAERLRTGASPPMPDDLARFEGAVAAAFARYLTDVHRGRVDPPAAGFDYHPGESHRAADLIASGLAKGDLAGALAEVEPVYPQYRRLKAALVRHRALAAQAPGRRAAPAVRRVRQIELALERLRWLPHAPAGRFLVANVPAFRLVAFESAASERPALQSAIVVGRAARTRTPLFADAVRSVIFRPFWYPPRSIIVNEIVPALRRDPGYLARERLDLVARGADDAAALPATPANITRLAAGSLQLRQRPGPHNALGLVKFVFPNRYDVYLHDTPSKGLFARARRDFSHGCIRVEKPAELALFLLSGRPEWTPEAVRAAMDGERTFRVDLPAAVPLFIYYTTAIVRQDGTEEFFADVYGRDAALERALRTARARRAP